MQNGNSYTAARAAVRLATAYLLRWMEIARSVHDDDVIYCVVFSVLWCGNISHLTARDFSELDEIPPDAERRPLTVAQIAESLDLPYETVRRRIVLMIERDMVRRVRGGYIVPQAVFARPELIEGLKISHLSLLRLLRDLKSAGVAI